MPVMSSSLPSSGSKRLDVRTVVCTGMLCAISYVVMFISKTIFAPLTVAGFLTFDMKDVIIAIGGFLYGPLNALCISLVTSVIEMFTVSETGPIGLLMNVLSRRLHLQAPPEALRRRGGPACGRRYDDRRHAAVELPHHSAVHECPPGCGGGHAAHSLSPL